MKFKSDSPLAPTLCRIATVVAVCAAVFCLVVCTLIIVNYLQTRSADPLNLAAIERLRADLRAQPANDQLKSQIRDLDLLARRAYFSSTAFARGGAALLVGGALALLIALGLLAALRRRLPDPGKFTGLPDQAADRRLARLVLGACGTALLVCAVALSLRVSQPPSPATAHGSAPAQTVAAAQAPTIPGPSREEILHNWPSFRGPDGNGVAFYTNAPVAWDGANGQGVLWKTEVPLAGLSSPVVWGNRVFLTGGDASNRAVFCFDAVKGSLLWRHSASGIAGSPTEPIEVSSDTGYAAASAATDGKRVFAIFATGDLVCLDLDGKRVWSLNVGVPANSYGHSSSLLTHRDVLYVQYDQREDARLMAFDCASGKELWRVARAASSWASPICVDTGSRMELILVCGAAVDSYDPRRGDSLWSQACLENAEVGPSAAYAGGMVFAVNEFAQGVGVRLPAKAGDTAQIVWKREEDLPDVASPVATAQFVIYAPSNGRVACLDAKKGDVLWQHEYDEGFYASPILCGSRVYALDRKGVMRIFAMGATYAAIGDAPLGEPSVCTPALMDGRVYIRGDKYLWCLGTR